MRDAPPWPVAIVTGMLGSGKTTMIAALLRHPAMADTLVLVNEFGAVGLDHTLFRAVTDAVILLPNGCLCCTIRSDIVQTLRELHRGWLAGTLPDFGRVLIETTGLAEPAPLIGSIVSHPLIADDFVLQSLSTVVDGQYGLGQIDHNATCRNQIAVADHLILSKGDLVEADRMATLAERARAINGLATVRPRGAVDPEWLFGRDAPPGRRSALHCDEASDHLAGLSTLRLRPTRPPSWTAFKIWLGGLLDDYGSHVLRLKGRLTFEGSSSSVLIQAVHHTFYPVVDAPPAPDGEGDDVLILIFEGTPGIGVADRIAHGGFTIC